MRAVILAAGEGRRTRPLTDTRPKALLELAGGALIDHVIRSVRDAGCKEVTVVVGHFSEPITAHFERAGLEHIQLVRQDRPLGTGDALRAAASLLTDETIVVNGDVLADARDVERVVKAEVPGLEVAMLAAEVADATRYGVVVGEPIGMGLLRAAHLLEKPERPPSNLVNAGVYKAGPALASALDKLTPTARGELELTSAIAALIPNGHVVVVPAERPWTEVGRPWDLLLAQERLMAKMPGVRAGEVEPGAVLKGDVAVSKGALVKSNAYIEGPVYIGPDARVGPHCYIRGATHIGEGCHVGAASELKNSILFAHTNAPHHNYVGDSVLGSHVNLGAGTKIANLRLDEREISVEMGGAQISTGLRKFGAVLGDGVKTGINASINAGTIIGPGAFVGPGARASGSIEAGARVM